MELLWYTVLLGSFFCLCRGVSIGHSVNNDEFKEKNDSHIATRGLKLSPIDIRHENIKEEPFPPLNNPFDNPNFDTQSVTCTNNGMTVSCGVDGDTAILCGGPLKDDYVLDTVHFHWGRSDYNGSEHLLDGRRFASEMHAIFRNSKYPNLTIATTKDDGLSILGWMGMESKSDSQAMQNLLDAAAHVIDFDAKVVGLAKDLLGFAKELAKSSSASANWVTYDGALTMEPYSDNVKWIIYDKPYAISHNQLEILRHLKRQDGTLNLEHSNEVVPLNGRSIYMPAGGAFHTDESYLKKNMLS